MADGISSGLQTSMLQLSNLIYSDEGTVEQKKSELDKVSKTVLDKISNESTSISTESQRYLDKIKNAILGKEWSEIPPPVKLNADLRELAGLKGILVEAERSATFDIYELFRMLMEHKRKQAVGLTDMSIKDSAQSIELSQQQFLAQEEANKWQLGADVASGVIQAASGFAQTGSALKSIKKNATMFNKNQLNIKQANDIQKDKISIEQMIKKNNEFGNEIKNARKDLQRTRVNNPSDTSLPKADKSLKDSLDKHKEANNLIADKRNANVHYDGIVQENSAKIQSGVDIARLRDQMRSGVINGIKGLGDVGVSGVKFQGNQVKVGVDRFELAKNLADKSSAALKEAGKNASDDIRAFMQTLSSIEQMLSSSLSNSLRA